MTTATQQDDLLAKTKPRLVSTQAIADFMDCSLHVIYSLIHAGEIPAIKIGAEYRIDVEEFMQWWEDWKRRQIEERKHGKQSA